MAKIETLQKEVAAKTTLIEGRDKKFTEVLIELEGLKRLATHLIQSPERQ